MKAYKTVAFIFCIMAALALLAHFYPRDGVQVGNVLAEFPSVQDVIGEEVETDTLVEEVEAQADTLTPEELVDLRMAELKAAKDSQFVSFCSKSPTRFYMPDDDLTYLDPVFEALEAAREKPVRIMHYGDSQLEGDRITGVLREKFQDLFGGNGPGLLPAVQTLGSATGRVTTSPELDHYMYFGSADFHADHKRYGPLAQVATVDSMATFTIQATGGSVYPHCRSFRKVSIAMMGEGEFTVSYDTLEQEMTCPLSGSESLRIFSAVLPRSVGKATITARGRMEVFGVMAEGTTGVSVDNIAMRGASGTLFSSIDSRSLAPFFHQQNVVLILLQYGGNSVPYLKGRDNCSAYKKQLESQIALFKRMAPNARIVFVGPSDMGTDIEGEMKTYPQLPMVVDSLRQAALDSGVAFWDMYHAMGGYGSMVRWVESDPPLAGEDYIHFTPLGAKHVSKMLYGAFELYYNYYRFRYGLDAEETPDSTTVDNS